jgi:hypothetical protein
MGGFQLYVSDDRKRVTLRPDELQGFVRRELVDVPDVVEADIGDRSKGDILSKGIAILQLAWFVLHLIARAVQNLPVTLLEIDTLAVAALTCIAYSLWWKKPKDVGRPYVVRWKDIASPTRPLAYEYVTIFWSEIMLNRLHSSNAQAGLVPGAGFSYFTYFVYPFLSLTTYEIISARDVHSRRAPSLGGYTSTHDYTTLLLGCLSGMVFGGIHLIGWYFLFQQHTEQILWRAASIAISCAPVFVFLFFGYRLSSVAKYLHSIIDDIIEVFLFSAMIASSFLYITARITLIILVLLSLRSLPPGAYCTVAWTQFIPHFVTVD